MQINSTVALVTGGCGGLGQKIAKLLSELGATVLITDIYDEPMEHLSETFHYYKMDVTDELSVKNCISEIYSQHPIIDILVNCAGKITSEPFVNIFNPSGMMLSYEHFKKDLSINLDSVFLVSSAFVEPLITKRKAGCIINISSICAQGNEGQTSYSAAKAAVNAMTITWAKELGPFGIRCNAVAPGFIETDSTKTALNEAQLKHIISNTPLRRLGTADEVAKVVISLIDNDFLNGVVLGVDGGLRI